MARRPRPRGRRGPARTAGIEWIGGTASLPTHVTDEGEPYRPEALFWMGADGAVLGTTLARPGELIPQASESLRSTIERPLCGPPHSPTRVRVASAELADALRAGHPGLEIVLAPTPELDGMLAGLKESLEQGEPGGSVEPSYLSSGAEPAAMASFFRAAAALYRAEPWRVVPADRSLLSVTVESLGVHDAVITVLGQLGESFGFVLLASADDLLAFFATAEAGFDEDSEVPPHLALHFEPGAEIEPALRREVAEHRWEIADDSAYPWLVAVDEELVARPPTPRELTLAEAIALALADLMTEAKALRAALQGGKPVIRTLPVRTHGGELDVTLHAPFVAVPTEFDPSRDLLAELAALARGDDEVDYDLRTELESELMRRFAAAPEGDDIEGIDACFLVADLAAHHLGQTLATLDASDLEEVLFELIPRKVSIEASEAREVVEAVRALYRYLDRELGLEQAGSCLEVLGGDAVERLEEALADPGNFDPAKAYVMEGIAAGHDMRSPEGIDAWMKETQARQLRAAGPWPDPGAQDPEAAARAARSKKNKRKTARKARKQNRKRKR